MSIEEPRQPTVGAEYQALADLLRGLPPERWETPSLCEGWRVREVVAHMTMPARYSEDAFMAELRQSDFDFTRLSDRLASRDAGLPTDVLVDQLRSDVMAHWTPPGGGYEGALNHVVVHGLDITVGLGEPRVTPDDTICTVLDALTTGGLHAHFGTALPQGLSASDLEWSYGNGPSLRGSAQDLVLHLTGRRLPAPLELSTAPERRFPRRGDGGDPG